MRQRGNAEEQVGGKPSTGRRLVVLAVAVTVVCAAPVAHQDVGGTNQRVDQAAIRETLRHGTLEARVTAMQSFLRDVPMKERSRETIRGVAAALIEYQRQDRQAIRDNAAGKPLPANGEERGIYHRLLLTAAIDSGDPVTIEALVANLSTGMAAIEAVGRFGGQALPAVRRVIEGKGTSASDLMSGLLCVREMVTRRRETLKPADLQWVNAVADRYLKNPPDYRVLLSAIRLAVATDDAALLTSVQSLTTEAGAAALSRGIPDVTTAIQKAAREALASRGVR